MQKQNIFSIAVDSASFYGKFKTTDDVLIFANILKYHKFYLGEFFNYNYYDSIDFMDVKKIQQIFKNINKSIIDLLHNSLYSSKYNLNVILTNTGKSIIDNLNTSFGFIGYTRDATKITVYKYNKEHNIYVYDYMHKHNKNIY